MTNLTFSGMPTGFDMSDPAHYDYKSQTVLGPNDDTHYSWITGEGDVVTVVGAGIDFTNDPPAFGTVTSVSIDLLSDGLGSANINIGLVSGVVDITRILTFQGVIDYLFSEEDYLEGTGFNDVFYGGSGNDDLYDEAGNDSMHGQLGDDNFYVGTGTDSYFGDGGTDTVHFQGNATTGVNAYLMYTGLDIGGGLGIKTLLGIENLEGTIFDDRLAGNSGDNTLSGGMGDDILKGKGGNDILEGGGGNDLLRTEAGDDTLYGGSGDDILFGLAGTDIMYGGSGIDYMYGGQGNDTMLGGGRR